nr:CD225/dispanin family protein [Prescottella defluvii]
MPGYTQQPYASAPQYQPAPAQYGGVPPLPPSNAGWAVAAILFFWPVAFSAFGHLHDIFPKWSMGDYQGALYASERVKTLGKIALGVGVGLIVLSFLMSFVMFAAFASAVNELDTNTTYQW